MVQTGQTDLIIDRSYFLANNQMKESCSKILFATMLFQTV